MENLLKYPALLLVIGILCFSGCDKDGRNNDDDDDEENGNIYDTFYSGDYRDNQIGTVEVVNNTVYDMLLFSGPVISTNYIVGGVRAGATNTVNFSTESDYKIGGFKILQAVKQSEFDAQKIASIVDWRAMVTYREGSKFHTTISFTEGGYQYRVSNRSALYSLELRKNSPDGERVVFIERAEVNKVVRCADDNPITVFPVWIAFNTETKALVNFTPVDYLNHPVTIEPKLPSDSVNSYNFPTAGEIEIFFPDN